MKCASWLAITVLVGLACATVQAAQPIRIVCVGDSITAGYTDASTSNFTFGYRGPLYTRLTNAGFSFQFVGTSSQPNLPPAFGPNLRTVHQDLHSGYGGATTTDMLNGKGANPFMPSISTIISSTNPDVVLLMIGINDIGQGTNTTPTAAQNNLFNIVQNIVNAKPNVKVIVGQITPYASYTGTIVRYNNYIKNTLASSFDNVTTVDQYSNLLTTGGTIDASLFSNGINHPNATAYSRMGDTWFSGIQAVVPEPSSFVLLASLGVLPVARVCWRSLRRRVRRGRGTETGRNGNRDRFDIGKMDNPNS